MRQFTKFKVSFSDWRLYRLHRTFINMFWGGVGADWYYRTCNTILMPKARTSSRQQLPTLALSFFLWPLSTLVNNSRQTNEVAINILVMY